MNICIIIYAVHIVKMNVVKTITVTPAALALEHKEAQDRDVLQRGNLMATSRTPRTRDRQVERGIQVVW